jgi:hypothetical protein
MRVTNTTPLGIPLFLPVDALNHIHAQTLKALHWTALVGNKECLTLLLWTAGINALATDRNEETILHYFARNGKIDLLTATIASLKSKEFDRMLNAKSIDDMSPVELCTELHAGTNPELLVKFKDAVRASEGVWKRKNCTGPPPSVVDVMHVAAVAVSAAKLMLPASNTAKAASPPPPPTFWSGPTKVEPTNIRSDDANASYSSSGSYEAGSAMPPSHTSDTGADLADKTSRRDYMRMRREEDRTMNVAMERDITELSERNMLLSVTLHELRQEASHLRANMKSAPAPDATPLSSLLHKVPMTARVPEPGSHLSPTPPRSPFATSAPDPIPSSSMRTVLPVPRPSNFHEQHHAGAGAAANAAANVAVLDQVATASSYV